MTSLHSLAHSLRTRHNHTSIKLCPELQDAIILRNWLSNLEIPVTGNGARIFGPNLSPVSGHRFCLDGRIRNDPWAYLDYLVYAHINSWKSINELVAEKCPVGTYVRDTYNRFVPPSIAKCAAPVILLLTLTCDQRFKHDVFDLQDIFTIPEKG
jgi:hypothetical protein